MCVKLLIIENDSTSIDLLRSLLRSREYEINAVNTGRQGLQAIRAQKPDAVILDWMTPGLDGYNFCKTVRGFSEVPILVLSAIEEPRTVANALDSGADDYLLKPVTSSILVASLGNLTRRVEMNGKGPKIKTAPLSQVK